MSDAVRIGILGDFNADFRSHRATNDALQHAARKLNTKVESEWLPTTSLTAPTAEKRLESFDGLWGAPGSPFKSFDGMLKGIEFARRRDWPFFAGLAILSISTLTVGGHNITAVYNGDPNFNTNTGTTKRAIVADWKAFKFYRGMEFRVDTSDVAGDRWDKNLIGFRGEEEIGINAKSSVFVGAAQLITGVIP